MGSAVSTDSPECRRVATKARFVDLFGLHETTSTASIRLESG